MSKKTLFMGGAALLLITFPVLIGCYDIGTPILPKLSYSVAIDNLGPNTMTVSFTTTRAIIDRTLKPDYTVTAANYYVVANKGSSIKVSTVNPGANDKSVVLNISDFQDRLVDGDTLVVAFGGAYSKSYPVKAPRPSTAAVATANKIVITFSDDVVLKGNPATAFIVTVSRGSFTVSNVNSLSSKVIELKDTTGTLLSKKASPITVKYTHRTTNKITGKDGIAIKTFTMYVDTSKLPYKTVPPG
jgi:hypothetical protein